MTDTSTDGAGTTPTPDAGTPTPPTAPTGSQPSAEQEHTGDQADVDELARLDPATLARLVREARADAAKARTTAKQKAAEEAERRLAARIAEALGITTGDQDTPPDPDKLAAELAAAQEQHRAARVELAVYRLAPRHGGDPDALLDSRSFLSRIEKLAPGDEEFERKIAAAIEQTIQDNPKYAAAGQAPARSGAPIPGRPAGSNRPVNLTDAVRRHYAR